MFQLQSVSPCSRAALVLAFVVVLGFPGGCGDDAGTGDGAATSGGEAGSEPGALGGAGTQAGGAGSPAAGAGGDGAGGSGGTGGGGQTQLYGYFDVLLNPALEETGTPANTSVIGKLYGGPTPVAMTLQQKMEAGDCKLLTPQPVFCSPSCTGGAICVSENNCVDFPASKSAGTVTLTGLDSGPIRMDVRANNYQPPAGTTIPYPPCTPGAEVKLETMGGDSAPFTLTTGCIAPLEAAPSIEIVRGQPLMLSWNAAADPSKSRVDVLVDISQHGTSKGRIECDLADTGAYAIDAKLVDALVELGFSGFPTVLLTRESESAAASGGQTNVSLQLKAGFRQAIEIEGLTSCVDNTQCPTGQTCQADLKCQ